MTNSYIYAETAFHHEGDLDFMLELIGLAKQAAVRGIKFQVLIDPNAFLSTKHSGYQSLSGFCFSKEQWEHIFRYATEAGLDVIVMPLDLQAVELTKEFRIKFLEIHSVSFYDSALIKAIKETAIPLIIGVGGRTIEEIKEKQQVFGKQLQILMMGFQAFPSKLKDLRLGKIALLKKLFPETQIGYADHSSFDDQMAVESNDYARLLGATCFEKHITTKEGEQRTDSASAIGIEKMLEIIERLKFIDSFILGGDSFLLEMTEPEKVYRDRQKKVVVTRSMKKGEQIALADLQTKMIDKNGGFISTEGLVGKELFQNIEADDLLTTHHLLK